MSPGLALTMRRRVSCLIYVTVWKIHNPRDRLSDTNPDRFPGGYARVKATSSLNRQRRLTTFLNIIGLIRITRRLACCISPGSQIHVGPDGR